MCPKHYSEPEQLLRIMTTSTIAHHLNSKNDLTKSGKWLLLLFWAFYHFSVVPSYVTPTPGSNLSTSYTQWQGLHVWIKCQHPTLCWVMRIHHLNIIITKDFHVQILLHYLFIVERNDIFESLPEFSAKTHLISRWQSMFLRAVTPWIITKLEKGCKREQKKINTSACWYSITETQSQVTQN